MPQGPRALGACFGYSVLSSSLEFRYLRDGSGLPMRIERRGDVAAVPEEPLMHWGGTTARPYFRLYRTDGTFSALFDRVGAFVIDPVALAIEVSPASRDAQWETLIWGIPAALCMIQRGQAALHAAAVEVDGNGLIFGAPGRFGKTTLASAFFDAGYRVLSEDVTCCPLSPVPSVLPGPAMLRVRRDSYEHFGSIAQTEVVAQDAARVYLALDSARRGDNAPVPLRSIVLLREGADGPRMEEVGGPEVLSDLWVLSFNLPTDDDKARCFDAVASLASSVAVWNLYRPIEFDELPRVVDTIIAACLGG